jgi:hypothetical protein
LAVQEEKFGNRCPRSRELLGLVLRALWVEIGRLYIQLSQRL